MARPTVSLLSAHRDQQWAGRILTHLSVLQRTGKIEVWSDAKLMGSEWAEGFAKMLSGAAIVIPIVTADFLASGFLAGDVLEHLLRRAETGEVVILPVIAEPCLWMRVHWLAQRQVLPRDGEPLSTHKNPDVPLTELVQTVSEVSQVMDVTRQEMKMAHHDTVQPLTSPSNSDGADSLPGQGHIFISHHGDDGDFADVLKLNLQNADFEAWIDTDRLRVGDDWRKEIDEAIRSAVALIVVMTPSAKSSEYVTYEWAFAWGAGVKVIPILL
jgi:uncharacterized protein YciU (UPF0263 family)